MARFQVFGIILYVGAVGVDLSALFGLSSQQPSNVTLVGHNRIRFHENYVDG